MGGEPSETIQQSRIPEAVDGIQVNFCKNPRCQNFGTPASAVAQSRGRYAVLVKERDSYTLTGDKLNTSLCCRLCGRYTTVKSNRAIKEEYDRITAYLAPLTDVEPSCPNDECPNHTVGVNTGKKQYQAFGKTSVGSPRYRCKSCGKTFSVATSTIHRQNKPSKNLDIFRLVMNSMPFRRMCKVTDLSMWTIFTKIDFIHKQCLTFAANRERKLFNGEMPFERLYISVDRQVYIVNWTNTHYKKNVAMSAICSADNPSGFVFGMHLNYDPAADRRKIEQEARDFEDNDKPLAHRRFARLWMPSDYHTAAIRNAKPKGSKKLVSGIYDEVAAVYDDSESRNDAEALEEPLEVNSLPVKGMQVHAEYTAYAHFLLLKKLCRQTERVRLFIDQDTAFLGASMSAFANEINGRDCDVFYVHTKSDMDIHEKNRAIAETKRELNRLAGAFPDYSEAFLKHELIKERMGNLISIGKTKDKWLCHPIATRNEPEKFVCYLTDMGDYDQDHLANLYSKASLQGIDRVFNQVRNMISVLSRQPASRSNRERQWFKHSAYNPERITKLLEIYRVYYNYHLVGKDKKTPAMRLGLAKSPIRLEDILYYK